MSQECDSNNNKALDEDLFNDYLTSSQDPDLSGEENENVKYQYDESNSGCASQRRMPAKGQLNDTPPQMRELLR